LANGVFNIHHLYKADMVLSSQIVSSAEALLINAYMEFGKQATAALAAQTPMLDRHGK